MDESLHICPRCSNFLNISKNAPLEKGGKDMNLDVETVIQRILLDEKVLASSLRQMKPEIEASPIYQKLNAKKKKIVADYLAHNTKAESENIAQIYWVCNNCNFVKTVNYQVLISSQNYSDVQVEEDVNVDNFLANPIYPRTRSYVCPNKKCPTHTDASKKLCVFGRKGKSFNVKNVCGACKHYWTS